LESELSERRARIARRLPAAALIALALAALYEASSLPFGTARQPDSGFYPILVCIALIVFAALALADAPQAARRDEPVDEVEHARVWLLVAALAVYAVAVTALGFLVCTAALLVLLLRVGRVSWVASIAAALLASFASYALFTRLGMPLPAGLLGF
jgi:hypothetical protein